MLRKIELNTGATLRVMVAGEGEAVLFVHGLGGNVSFWAGQVRTLSKRFRVVRCDLRGHGASSPSTDQTPLDHARDLVALLDALDIEKTHVVGLSMGGIIAQTLAARFPERLNRLVLLATTARFPEKGKAALGELVRLAETEGMEAVARAFAPRLFGGPVPSDDKRLESLIDALSRQDSASFAAAARAAVAVDTTPLLGRIHAETLLCYGENDRQTPPFMGEYVASRLANARMVVFPSIGHVVPLEIPDELNRVLSDFLGGGPEALSPGNPSKP